MDRRLVLLLSTVLLGSLALGAQEDLRPLERKVEKLRGLTFKRPVVAEFVGQEGMKAEVLKELNRSYPPGEWSKTEKTLKIFGLVPPKMNLRAVLEGLLEEQVAGLYDPVGKRLFVNKGPLDGADMLEGLGLQDLNLNDAYLIHELDHALTDQRFNLQSLPLDDKEDEDRADAARCVVEGDATWVMLRYLYDQLKVPPDQQQSMENMMASMGLGKELLGSAYPAYLQENLLASYLAGTELVKRAYDWEGFEGVNRLYKHPPESMEQVLQPDKYFAGVDHPKRVQVELPAAWTSAGWKELDRGVWGVLNTQILLKEWGVKEAQAEQAAKGWGGDAYVVAEGPGGEGFVWATVWDTEKDAQEFEAAIPQTAGLHVVRQKDRVTVTKGPLAGLPRPEEKKPAGPEPGPRTRSN